MSALEEYAEFKANVKPLDDPIQEAFEVYADAAIAELKAELATVNSLLDMKREREQHWSDEAWRYKNMNEQLRAERGANEADAR